MIISQSLRSKVTCVCAAALVFLATADCRAAKEKYSAQEKRQMLALARRAIEFYLKFNQVIEVRPEELTPNLREARPCFVTLEKRGYGLRGCLGMFDFDRPLYGNIIDRAIASATQDGRFPMPVAYEELKDIRIEISVLTEPKEINFNSAQGLLDKLRPFTDGVILYTPYGSSTYLPQVWQQLPAKEDFLSQLCLKHGAPEDYWVAHPENLRVEVYRAEHFQEAAYGGTG